MSAHRLTGPSRGLTNLTNLYAGGSTRVVDCDLSPLLGLPKLSRFFMKERPFYSQAWQKSSNRLESMIEPGWQDPVN
jgi:hypothetical protein